MKRALLLVSSLLLVALMAVPARSQKGFDLGIGAEVLVPTGTFGDAYKIGYGITARGQYNFTSMLSAGATLGWDTWSAKDVPAGFSAPKFSGVPFRVYGKYYFMPPKTPRVYGMLGLGLFFWSSEVTLPAYSIGGATFGGSTVSTTGSDFNLAPEVGIEIPAGGNVNMDLSARYDMIMTSGNTTGNLGIRAGVTFGL